MSSLVLDLQKEALDPSTSTLSLLRKALVVATKLKLEDFKEWIKSETEGYQNMSIVPEYRHLKSLIEYYTPLDGWKPIVGESQDEIFESLQGGSRYLYSAISDLEILFNQSSNLEVRDALNLEIKISAFYSIDVQSLCIKKVSIGRILETIRDIILKWSLDLEENGILGEGMSFSQQEKESAVQHKYEFNNTIQNFNATVGAVQTGNKNIANVNQTIDLDKSEILQAITDLREKLDSLSPDDQEIAADAIDTLQSEITTPTKPIKIKSALHTLWNVGQKVASFANAVTAIAQRFGIDFNLIS